MNFRWKSRDVGVVDGCYFFSPGGFAGGLVLIRCMWKRWARGESGLGRRVVSPSYLGRGRGGNRVYRCRRAKKLGFYSTLAIVYFTFRRHSQFCSLYGIWCCSGRSLLGGHCFDLGYWNPSVTLTLTMSPHLMYRAYGCQHHHHHLTYRAIV